MGRKDIDVIDFSHSSGASKRTPHSKSERIDVPGFVDSAHSKKDYGRHAHEADFVLPLISSSEESAWEDNDDGYADGYDDRYGHGDARYERSHRDYRRSNTDRVKSKAKKNKKQVHFRCDKLVLLILVLFIAYCGWTIYHDYHGDNFDAKAAVAPSYEEGLGSDEQTTQTQAAVAGYHKNNKVVCIDPGHGGSDSGAEYKKNYEKTQVLEMAKLVKAQLEADGFTVVLTRDSDKTLTLDERVKIAEEANAGVLVSIHRNFYQDSSKSGASQASGVECWVSNTRPSDATQLSNMILVELNKLSLTKNRGVKCGTINNANRNYRINTSKCTSCIVELGFITNSRDDALVTTKKTECAKAIADGIEGYLKSL